MLLAVTVPAVSVHTSVEAGSIEIIGVAPEVDVALTG